MYALTLLLNLHFYPALLPYQANAQTGKWLRANGVGADRFLAAFYLLFCLPQKENAPGCEPGRSLIGLSAD